MIAKPSSRRSWVLSLVGVALLATLSLATSVVETKSPVAVHSCAQSLEETSCERNAADTTSARPEAKPHRRGYCQCSCGAPCNSSADCGGAACRPFITCC